MTLEADRDLLAQLESNLILSHFQRWLRDLLRWHIATYHSDGAVVPPPYPDKAMYAIKYATKGEK